jgi:hypothetical protein
MKLPNCIATGMTNVTQDRMFVPFFDYDGVDLKTVRMDVRKLQLRFDLGTFVIAHGGGKHFHAIGFTRLELPELEFVLQNSVCDEKYKTYALKSTNRSWVLRLTAKKNIRTKKEMRPAMKYLETVHAPTSRQASRAHVMLINKFYGIDVMRNFRLLDRYKRATFITYPTRAG